MHFKRIEFRKVEQIVVIFSLFLGACSSEAPQTKTAPAPKIQMTGTQAVESSDIQVSGTIKKVKKTQRNQKP